MVFAKPNFGISEICPIDRTSSQLSFKYQKRKFLWNEKLAQFSPPIFFVDDETLKIGDLKAKKGLSTSDLESLGKKYGRNVFDIPVPTFWELFVEHALAPFFVFQVFSIALWMMDDMWYLSLFSLFMLVSFECTTVWQRKSTMTEFQSMGIKAYQIYVYRNSKWIQISTDDLLPGDIVSVVRTPQEDLSVPCDLILLAGSCIVNEAMLSGESTPLLKESIETREADSEFLPTSLDKNSLLHGGTSCLQVTVPEHSPISLAPDNGAIAIVAKTGFETVQGSLVRVMIFSSERMTVANKESLFFILFLLVFAVIAARYVWIEGTRMGRIQSKLILDCIIVITSVVPPELPMELTMAVNQSLAALAKHFIYCTEPFRIPLAGRIDVCCFDKTGTLTAEDLMFEGLAGFKKDDISHLSGCSSPEVPSVTLDVMGSTHALVRLDSGEVVGDPMEKETLKVSNWALSKTSKNTTEGHGRKIHILKRFQFSSALKRSSVISKIGGQLFVGCKGAPETIAERLVKLPADYEKTFKSFTRSGSRVLALAYKNLDAHTDVEKIERHEIEAGLTFAGFMVFHCPMKSDAIETIAMLNQSSHRSIMITGDNPLTACHVAKEVGIVSKPVFILDKPEKPHSNGKLDLEWRNIEETNITGVSSDDELDSKIFSKHDICVTGYALEKLQKHSQFKKLIRHAFVYSRVSPSQKELILNTYKAMNYNTLMCGDGTNDVGALKQAHVGIALLNGTESSLKMIQEKKQIEATAKVYEKQREIMARWGRPPPNVPVAISHLYPPGRLNPNYISSLQKRGVEITEEIIRKVEIANQQPVTVEKPKGAAGPQSGSDIAEQLMSGMQMPEDQEAPALKLGDASVAAPFTSKLANVNSVVNVVRQGRCALVSTIQMYKILALNCLISAYSLSVLYLAGIKFGDAQATVSGLLLSVCFLSISKGKPLDQLSKERPQPGIFNTYIMGSILGQFAVHLIALIYLNKEIYLLEPREPQVDLDKVFEPSLLNTAMFLIQLSQQVATFAVNYIGRPFREGITENKGMFYGMLGVVFMCVSGATEFIPEFNSAMQFVPMTMGFKVKLNLIMFLDFAISWLVEIFFKFFFMDYKAADIAVRDADEVAADDIRAAKEQEKKDQ
ncbi:DEKNAAC104436 [Brettanomyces naardenensis]|uniref:DEKNAAC104436 n=1 Tax=Brettanomyces naardenensis TaxID=13370 RepID=A0A448YQY9_BRENA|nr:DEKNAAC104436 [Brettanomyces naardenensis]